MIPVNNLFMQHNRLMPLQELGILSKTPICVRHFEPISESRDSSSINCDLF